MRLVGHRTPDGRTVVGDLRDDGSVDVLGGLDEFWHDPVRGLAGPPLAGRSDAGRVPAAQVRLVPPVLPGARVLCVGLNYADHVAEGSYSDQAPAYPVVFGRWAGSLTTDGATVPSPLDERLDWEGEVVAWVGRPLRGVTAEEARAAVVGYSTFNDLTARSAQKLTSQWTVGKNADASGPLGPLVPVTDVGDLRDGLRLRTRVNGEVVQDASTSQMIFDVGEVLALVSRTLTLAPGDLLATGTPSGVGYARTPPWLLDTGDHVEVEVERLGVVGNLIGPPLPTAGRSPSER